MQQSKTQVRSDQIKSIVVTLVNQHIKSVHVVKFNTYIFRNDYAYTYVYAYTSTYANAYTYVLFNFYQFIQGTKPLYIELSLFKIIEIYNE
jgi:hypothetical protein